MKEVEVISSLPLLFPFIADIQQCPVYPTSYVLSFPCPRSQLTSSLRSSQQPTVVLLREGTDSSQGTPQLLSNISACVAVAQTIATTLGPRGMDKLIVNERGEATISSE